MTTKGLKAALALALALTAPALVATPQALADDKDPLKQVVGENEQFSTQPTEIKSGHMDIGPRVIDGKWQLAVRDDSRETPVWRSPESIVFRLPDQAMLTVPEGGAYDFTGANSGEKVHVVPQTQIPGVPWLGWNTQSPEVSRSVQKGVNLSLVGAQGPGNVNVYLESGNFKKPIQLWDKRQPFPQSIWVDLNTHTHANWVFTKPGIYKLAIAASATGLDGQVRKAIGVFRFAVGDAVPTDQALGAKWDGPLPAAPAPTSALAGSGAEGGTQGSAGAKATAEGGSGSGGTTLGDASAENPVTTPVPAPASAKQADVPSQSAVGWLPVVIAVSGGVVLIVALAVYFLRGRKAREAVERELGGQS